MWPLQEDEGVYNNYTLTLRIKINFCFLLQPEYVSAADKLKQQGIKGKLIAVDAQKEPSLGTRFGIKGYPSVKYFKNGEFAFDVSLREEGPIGINSFISHFVLL